MSRQMSANSKADSTMPRGVSPAGGGVDRWCKGWQEGRQAGRWVGSCGCARCLAGPARSCTLPCLPFTGLTTFSPQHNSLPAACMHQGHAHSNHPQPTVEGEDAGGQRAVVGADAHRAVQALALLNQRREHLAARWKAGEAGEQSVVCANPGSRWWRARRLRPGRQQSCQQAAAVVLPACLPALDAVMQPSRM